VRAVNRRPTAAFALLALALLAPCLHAQPSPWLEDARRAARENRNEEAAALFERALQAAPGRRAELLPEYADQLTYSGRARDAVPLYREALQGAAGDHRLRLLKSLGLALLWSDQPSAARPVYEDYLRSRPDDADARRNHARALSWSGRQREAVRALQPHVAAHPADGEARVQLAQAQAWMGRLDAAHETLSRGGLPDRDDARRLMADLQRWAAPRTLVDVQRSSQSDRLDIAAARLEHEVPWQHGRGAIGARLERFDYERDDGSDGARVTRPMALARWRFDDAWEIHAEAGQERIAPRGSAALDRLVYSGWLTWWPSDLLRMDLSTRRGTFDNLTSLRMGLTARQHALSADLTPDERQKYSARIEYGDYSDGNRRWWGQVEGEYRFMTHPDLWAGVRHQRMSFSQLLNNGYFNPLDFEATLLTLRGTWRPRGDDARWEVNGLLAYGREHADPGGGKPVYDVSLRASYRAGPQTRLEARAQRFSSRTGSASGFARTIYGVQLERTW
jgi:tetratricopeptide (TPR) repeat protein